jgi:hypothetical protein
MRALIAHRARAAACAAILLLAAAAPIAAQDAASGEWIGSYRCTQGETALDLHIEPLAHAAVQAVFFFHAAARHPGVPDGCFLMRGTLQPDRTLALHAVRWLLRPPGYAMVDLHGILTPDGRNLTGQVDYPLCGAFSLRHSSAPIGMPAPCHDGALQEFTRL